jgi:hypothetical protein
LCIEFIDFTLAGDIIVAVFCTKVTKMNTTILPPGPVADFAARCVYGLSKKDAEVLAHEVRFSTLEWLQVRAYCMNLIVVEWYFENEPERRTPKRSEKQCYTMATCALRQAMEKAVTSEDWMAIYRSLPSGREKIIARNRIRILSSQPLSVVG